MKSGSLANQVRVARKMEFDLKKSKATIKKQFENHDPIEVDGKTAGFKASPSARYPMKKYHDYAIERIVPIEKITISQTDAEKPIKKLIKQDKLDQSDMSKLEEMKIESKSTRFTI